MRLRAAEKLITENNIEKADAVITQLTTLSLNREDSIRLNILQIQLAIEVNDTERALHLTRNTLTQGGLSQEQEIKILEYRAQARSIDGEFYAAARDRIYLTPLLKNKAKHINHENIWSLLQKVPMDQLKHYAAAPSMEELNGWLELALLMQTNQADLDSQLSALLAWQNSRPHHVAATTLPGELSLLAKIAQQKPKHIALLLPLSGKLTPFGQAVRDGFLAAYYRAHQAGSDVPEISVIDTEGKAEQTSLYEQATNIGADLVIGPISKTAIRNLQKNAELAVTTLSLNYGEPTSSSPSNLFQFGLAAEEEARQAAQRAWQDGHKRAVIISPDSAWGQRVQKAFTQEWQTLGGSIPSEANYKNDANYADMISKLFSIDKSKQRARALRRLLGEKLEFTPRRRQDVDMVFLVAHPKQGRQIKPTLAFQYAGKLPVYATSHIFSGKQANSRDTDLNNIMFCDIPWLLESDSPIKNTIRDSWPKRSQTYNRFYALGVDAFSLYPRLEQLSLFPNSTIAGQTGYLSLDQQRRIHRQLTWAQIRNGKLVHLQGNTPNNEQEAL